MAVMNCASFHAPMPSVRSEEMLGTWKVPNGERKASPPPSLVLSSCLGTAWQDAQPPAKNITLPLARSGVWEPSALAGTVAGIVRNHNAANPSTTTTAPATTSLRSIFPLRQVRSYSLTQVPESEWAERPFGRPAHVNAVT